MNIDKYEQGLKLLKKINKINNNNILLGWWKMFIPTLGCEKALYYILKLEGYKFHKKEWIKEFLIKKEKNNGTS